MSDGAFLRALADCIVGLTMEGAGEGNKVTIGQRVAFADSARTGRLVADLDANSPAAREIAALAAEIARIGR